MPANVGNPTAVKLITIQNDNILEIQFNDDWIRFPLPKNLNEQVKQEIKRYCETNSHILQVAKGYSEKGYVWFYYDLLGLCQTARYLREKKILNDGELTRFLYPSEGRKQLHDFVSLFLVSKYSKFGTITINGDNDFNISGIPVEVKILPHFRVSIPTLNWFSGEANQYLLDQIHKLISVLDARYEEANTKQTLNKGIDVVAVWDTTASIILDLMLKSGSFFTQNLPAPDKKQKILILNINPPQPPTIIQIPHSVIVKSIRYGGNIIQHIINQCDIVSQSESERKMTLRLWFYPKKYEAQISSKLWIPLTSISLNGKEIYSQNRADGVGTVYNSFFQFDLIGSKENAPK